MPPPYVLAGHSFGGYTTLDLYTYWRVAQDWKLQARVNNLGNERYEPIYGYPAPGRTLSFEFATR